MHDSTSLYGADPDRLLAWLEELVNVIKAETAVVPNRPYAGMLTPSRMGPHNLPLYLRPQQLEIVGLYRQLPGPGLPFGAPVCALGVEKISNEGRPLDPSFVPVHLWSAESFPLTVRELRWLLELSFPHAPAAWIPIPSVWLAKGLSDGTVNPNVVRKSRIVYKATLETNRWLETELAALDPTADVQHLYPEWLRHYMDERQGPPKDPARSFERAVESARNRISKRKKRNGK